MSDFDPRGEPAYEQFADQMKASEAGFKVIDTGKRASFASGMVRNAADDKIDYTSVLDGPMFERWAAHLTKAKKIYPDVAPGVANWTLASSEEELVRFKKSFLRHAIQWLRGDTDEDHAAAIMFNVNGAEHTKVKMKEKKAA